MLRRYIDRILSLSIARKIGIVAAIYIGLFGLTSIAKPADTTVTSSNHVQGVTARIEHSTIVTTEVIPFTTTTTNNPQLASGVTRVAVAGVNGERTRSYDVTYKNGVEISRVEIASLVTIAPVAQVQEVGTATRPTKTDPGWRCQDQATFFGISICRPRHGDD